MRVCSLAAKEQGRPVIGIFFPMTGQFLKNSQYFVDISLVLLDISTNGVYISIISIID